ncbi:MAG: T9SS type A sorting domain-containing protein, partial [Bacteroidales bacterium]|nr:T9SS type A sorting domain-containing protein [Bacteroidales bacterium]
FEWVVYPEGNGNSVGLTITIDDEGYLYTAGKFSDTINFGGYELIKSQEHECLEDNYFGKFDSNGQVVWIKSIPRCWWENPKVLYDNNEHIYLCGYFTEELDLEDTVLTTLPIIDPPYTYYTTDLFITKFTKDGNLVWVRQISNTDPIEGVWSFTLGFNADCDMEGNLYLQGRYDGFITYEPDYSFPVSNNTNYLLKISPEGELLWNSLNPQIRIWDIACDNNNDVYLTGVKESLAPEDTLFFANDTITDRGILLKQNSDGNELWGKVLPGGGMGHKLSFNKNNNIYSTVYYNDTANYLTTTFYPNEMWLNKFNLLGEIIWTRKIINHSKIVSNSKSVFIGSDFSDTTIIGNDTLIPLNNSPDIYILKINSEGEYQWTKTAGGTSSDVAFDLVIDNKENVFFTGWINNNVWFDDINISSIGSSTYIAKIDTVLVTKTNLLLYKDKILLYPNPTNNQINIEFATQLVGSINFYDLTGKKVISTSISGENKKIINVSELKSGMYFLEIVNKNTNENTTYKIIKN